MMTERQVAIYFMGLLGIAVSQIIVLDFLRAQMCLDNLDDTIKVTRLSLISMLQVSDVCQSSIVLDTTMIKNALRRDRTRALLAYGFGNLIWLIILIILTPERRRMGGVLVASYVFLLLFFSFLMAVILFQMGDDSFYFYTGFLH